MAKPLWQRMHGMCEDLIQMAVDEVTPHNQADIEAFAKKLSGLEGLTIDEVRERLADVAIPGDFRHFRFTNLTTGLPSAGVISAFLQPIEMNDIIVVMYCVLERDDTTLSGKGVWTETVALPVISPGTLELGVRFRPLQ